MIYPHFTESAADVGKDGMALECLFTRGPTDGKRPIPDIAGS